MREVLFKNMTSIKSRKKDTLLQEVYEKNGIMAKTERRYFYYIKDIAYVENNGNLESWVNRQNTTTPLKKKHFHILRKHIDKSGEDKLICKVAGTFYAVVGQMVYTIAFLHAFKVKFSKATCSK